MKIIENNSYAKLLLLIFLPYFWHNMIICYIPDTVAVGLHVV